MKVAGRAIVFGAMVCAAIGVLMLISYSSAEKADLFAGTATRVYRLQLPNQTA